jgi:hypothetical protein
MCPWCGAGRGQTKCGGWVLQSRMDGFSQVLPALRSLLPGALFSRESPLLIPFQRVLVHLLGAMVRKEAAKPSLGLSVYFSGTLLPTVPTASTLLQICEGECQGDQAGAKLAAL